MEFSATGAVWRGVINCHTSTPGWQWAEVTLCAATSSSGCVCALPSRCSCVSSFAPRQSDQRLGTRKRIQNVNQKEPYLWKDKYLTQLSKFHRLPQTYLMDSCDISRNPSMRLESTRIRERQPAVQTRHGVPWCLLLYQVIKQNGIIFLTLFVHNWANASIRIQSRVKKIKNKNETF